MKESREVSHCQSPGPRVNRGSGRPLLRTVDRATAGPCVSAITSFCRGPTLFRQTFSPNEASMKANA